MYKCTNITKSRNFFKKVVTNTRQTTLTKQKLLSGAKIGGVWILIIATGEQAIRFPIDMIGTMAYEGLHIKENNCEQRTV